MPTTRACTAKASANLLRAVFLAALLLLPLAPARAFEDGATGLSISLGAGKQLDRGYTVLAGRYGYYVVSEFEASLAFETWRGNDPAIYKVVPELRYVYSRAVPIKPYFGVFLSRTFYDGLPDRNSFGGKTGGYLTLNRGAHLGIGVVYERIEGCDEGTYRKCSQVYPEVAMHFTF